MKGFGSLVGSLFERLPQEVTEVVPDDDSLEQAAAVSCALLLVKLAI